MTASQPAAVAPAPRTETRDARVAVVIPIPDDPDWSIFAELGEDVPIIVVDDSDGRLAPAPRDNVAVYDYAAQREVMGEHYDAISHRSAATRNFGHVLAFREGYDVVVALDYDCRPRGDWLETHLAALGPVQDAPALAAPWINSIGIDGIYARGFPYEERDARAPAPRETLAGGEVKVNMGLWDGVLDLNGIDKLQRPDVPTDPGVRPGDGRVALGNVPVCGMNTAFRAEVTPAYFFLPDVLVNGTWNLSRHDDIWGGYVLKQLMDLRGDLMRFGAPVVEHTKQSRLDRVVVHEHWMHLMAADFYAIVDAAVARVAPGDYAAMFGAFTDAFLGEVDRSRAPRHHRETFRELGDWMERWVRCFA